MNNIIKAKSDYLNILVDGDFEYIKEYLLYSNHKEYLSVVLPDGSEIDCVDFLNDFESLRQKFER